MKAMVLAAGLGTRLRPLTNDRPKALVEVGGRTMLEITLTRLKDFDIRDVIVNVHHFADLVIDYLKINHNFGLNIAVSREDVLLDTGGGLKKAGWFFSGDATPFVLHNVDVVSTIDMNLMVEVHKETNALITLAVQDRKTSRPLLFDEHGFFCGRITQNRETEIVRPSSERKELAFCGIHVISPRFLSLMTGDGAFPIIPAYLQVAATEPILAFRADDYYWRDLGKPEHVLKAAEEMKQNSEI
jgi:NDP-sugar pyrophosphorylase family protein